MTPDQMRRLEQIRKRHELAEDDFAEPRHATPVLAAHHDRAFLLSLISAMSEGEQTIRQAEIDGRCLAMQPIAVHLMEDDSAFENEPQEAGDAALRIIHALDKSGVHLINKIADPGQGGEQRKMDKCDKWDFKNKPPAEGYGIGASVSPPESNAGEESSDYKFLMEMARYFRNRPTNGEDRAHWANVYNAENCERIAAGFRHDTSGSGEVTEKSAVEMGCNICHDSYSWRSCTEQHCPVRPRMTRRG